MGRTMKAGLTRLSFIPTREKILILTPLATAEIHIPTGMTVKKITSKTIIKAETINAVFIITLL